MSIAAALGDACLAAGVLVLLGCCLGVLRMRTAMDRLHFTAPATTLGPALIAAAVLLDGSGLQAGIKAVAIAVLLGLSGPVLTHVFARAIRARETGRLEPADAEVRAGTRARREAG